MPTAVALLGTGGIRCAFLSLWPALAGYVSRARAAPPSSVARVLAAAGALTLAEWLRGYTLHRLPVACCRLFAAARQPARRLRAVGRRVPRLARGGARRRDARARVRRRRRALAAVRDHRRRRHRRAVRSVAALAGRIAWTSPEGEPLAVSLVQGNVAQELKFDPQFREQTFALYAELVESSRGRLIVLPESAFPMFADEVPDARDPHLVRTASARRGDVLLGLFAAEAPAPGSTDPRYYNTRRRRSARATCRSIASATSCRSARRFPARRCFGWFIRNVLAIPLADQTPGAARAAAVRRRGNARRREHLLRGRVRQRADRRRRAPRASRQRHQRRVVRPLDRRAASTTRSRRCARSSSAARCCARPTPASRRRSRIRAACSPQLPWFTRGVLEVTIDGRTGATPYQRFGDGPALALAAALVALAAWRARRRA